MAANPPEIVGMMIASTLSSLAEVASWPVERVAERAALEARLVAEIAADSGENAATVAAALFSQCVLRQELADRERTRAPTR